MDSISLRFMQARETGTIETVNANGIMGRRLRDMGLVPGTIVTILGHAPLRDPVALKVLNTTLTLRNAEADHIQVNVNRKYRKQESQCR